MAHFTREQLKELEIVFGLTRNLKENELPVRDGVVTGDSMVWWRALAGPEHVRASSGTHWQNIRAYPDVYQLAKPYGSTQFVYACS